MKALIPLQQSHEHDAFETELKQVFVALYQTHLADAAQNINVYGTPYLGNRDLLQKSLVADGIGNFEAENVDLSVLKYLHMARRYRNGKRGLHLLNTYLRALWRDDYKAYQLYFVKDGVYAQDASLFSPTDIEEMGRSAEDFVLTSRVRIELSPDLTPVDAIPSDVANSLDDTLPARLFIHDIVVRRDVNGGMNIGQHSDFFSVTRETVVKFEVEEAVYLTSKPYPTDEFEALQTSVSIQSIEIKNVMVALDNIEPEAITSSAIIESVQLKNVLVSQEASIEAITSSAIIESAQLKNVLVNQEAPIEAITSNAAIESAQLKNVLITNDAQSEALSCSILIQEFHIDD